MHNGQMERLQKKIIERDLNKKMVFLTGPRQVGKTTLAKSFSKEWPHLIYLNYDSEKDRPIILKQEWNRKSGLVIFDEIHKLKKWKNKLKGIYDTEGIDPRILVTGSARLDVYRRGSDSLAGRYYLHRLYPFSVRELRGTDTPKTILDRLLLLGGFPEPYLSGSEEEAARWRKTHLERIIREDIQDLNPVKDVQTLILLIDMLRERVGSSVSYGSLARDLEISPHTLKRWIQILENMYIIFVIPSYHRNLARAILKEPKIYFYDTGAVKGNLGTKFENTVALCLRKWMHYLEDTKGKNLVLYYLRDKEKREVDFVILEDGKIKKLIEVKLSNIEVSPSLQYYHKKLKSPESIQLVHENFKPRTVKEISIMPAAAWLNELDI